MESDGALLFDKECLLSSPLKCINKMFTETIDLFKKHN